jgi:hypothetical protein
MGEGWLRVGILQPASATRVGCPTCDFPYLSLSLRHDQTNVWSIGIVLVSFSHSVAFQAIVGPI